jgi:hypothetical protein
MGSVLVAVIPEDLDVSRTVCSGNVRTCLDPSTQAGLVQSTGHKYIALLPAWFGGQGWNTTGACDLFRQWDRPTRCYEYWHQNIQVVFDLIPPFSIYQILRSRIGR